LISYAQLRPGAGFSPSRAAFYYLQRLAGPLRGPIAPLIARGVALRHPAAGGAGLESQRKSLARDGLVHLPDLASPDCVGSIRAHLKDKDLKANGRAVKFQDITPEIATADYPLQTVLSCPAIVDLINAPAVLNLAGAYLGCSPTLSSVGLRWSFPTANAPRRDVQRFHRDPDDWRFLKLFVYLTDVDQESGPHVYVRGSHRATGGIRARAYDDRTVERRYGSASITPVTGKAGTAFMADTSGIHMGMPPRGRPRLMLAAQYSLLPIFAFRYTPVQLEPAPSVDRYVNRLLIA
jgi:hypothetical protein